MAWKPIVRGPYHHFLGLLVTFAILTVSVTVVVHEHPVFLSTGRFLWPLFCALCWRIFIMAQMRFSIATRGSSVQLIQQADSQASEEGCEGSKCMSFTTYL